MAKMAVNANDSLVSLIEVLGLVYWEQKQRELSLEGAIVVAVQRVSARDLGRLILEAEDLIDPFTVASRQGIGSIRYPDSWEMYLRDVLSCILLAALENRDWVNEIGRQQ